MEKEFLYPACVQIKNEKKRKEIMEWIISLAVVIFIAFIARSFVLGTNLVKGISMQPTFEHDDYVVLNKITYRFSDPKRGDIVVCSYDKGTQEENIIKRVIGTPGDIIDIKIGDEYQYIVLVNGEAIDESYLGENMEQKGDIEYPFTVPEGCYFVMGDNRNSSNDSRSKLIGAIPKENIDGKVIIRLMPFDRFATF